MGVSVRCGCGCGCGCGAHAVGGPNCHVGQVGLITAADMQMHAYTCARAHTHTHTNTHTHIHTHTCLHTHMYTHVHTRVRIHTHAGRGGCGRRRREPRVVLCDGAGDLQPQPRALRAGAQAAAASMCLMRVHVCVCLMRVHISLACTRTCEIEKHTLVSEGCVYAGGRVLHSTCAHAGTLQGAGAERSGGGARAAPGSAGFPPFCTPLF